MPDRNCQNISENLAAKAIRKLNNRLECAMPDPSTLWSFSLFLVLMLVSSVSAQTFTNAAKISVSENSEVKIEVKVGSVADSCSFLNSYAGAVGLGERIKNFEAFNSDSRVGVRRIASGEYRLDQPADSFRYEVGVAPQRPGDLAHVSWLTKTSGFLMLSDLLPEAVLNENSISLKFELPPMWSVESSFSHDKLNTFTVTDPLRAVFILADKFDVASSRERGISCKVVSTGKMKSKDVLKSASKVLSWYRELTGSSLNEPATILVGLLPPSLTTASWKAETRGSTTILLLNSEAPIKNWKGQVGIVLTHELFHLWVPNSLKLTGDYDWFFEGFTLYVALRAALKLKLIDFQEYLGTIARVYDSYLSYEDGKSLIAASETRWTSSAPVVYDKGMLVAFLFDLTLRNETNLSTNLEDKYKALFNERRGEPTDANEAIIKLLSSSPATGRLAMSYIQGKDRVELEKIVPAFGFQLSVDGPKSHLSVQKELNVPQKQLMKSLGYRE